ncbi:carbohydrate ABC transporter permease [Petroclostridium xylanilyticum]|jgi:raffinose/stachyose/melibiose transport system permease protein|uniref:carbohydrate ABC transporter permease n=1 Tax=Petroclostridium xylanilyticum TaxID=1792311 RepID=UPI000B98667E|nr:carbohydrate ABC transporter permease [Petroclostridium xylanilyticum]
MKEKQKYTANTLILQVIMTVVILFYFVPTYITINYAFKDTQDKFNTSPIELPTKLFFGNFLTAVKKIDYFRSLGNTFIITTFAVILIIILSGMAAFSLARRNSKIYKASYLYFILGILVPYQAILVPLYIVGKRLGFVNNLAGVIFLYTATGLPFGVFMMTGFMKTVPMQLEEAALIDGCSVFGSFWRIIFPLLKPAAATLAILQSFQIWNDFLMPFLFLQKMALKTLTLRQFHLFEQYRSDLSTAFAAIIISTLPIIIFFTAMQKYFIKGISMGAVKG